jgi:thiamine biosynthesis lipoprotein ApbE
VVAGRAWRAETVATALLVTGDRARRDALVVGPGTGALVVEADGGPTLLGRIEEHLR